MFHINMKMEQFITFKNGILFFSFIFYMNFYQESKLANCLGLPTKERNVSYMTRPEFQDGNFNSVAQYFDLLQVTVLSHGVHDQGVVGLCISSHYT